MTERNLSQEDVAKDAGTSQQAVSRWLAGAEPSPTKLSNFAKANGIPIQHFFALEPAIEVKPDPERARMIDLGNVEFPPDTFAKMSPQGAESGKDYIDEESASDTLATVRVEKSKVPTWQELKETIKLLTSKRGEKKALADECGVSRQVLGNWLSDDSQGSPSAALTLKLLAWAVSKQGK